MEIGLYIEAQEGLTWNDWRRLVTRAETLGFDAIVTSVHLMSLQASGRWALDVWPLLTTLAQWTKRIHFGPMVLPITFYHPVQIARLSASLYRLSGGRFRLRLGAGREPGEHEAFGLPFPEHDERIAMLGEVVQIIHLLWSGDRVSYQGRWYCLEGAQLQPTPEHLWVGVAGDSEPSLRVAATWADEWCTSGPSPGKLRQHLKQLDSLARKAGRRPDQIERSVMSGVLVGHDESDLERRAVKLIDLIPELAGQEPSAILSQLATEWQWWIGTPEEIVGQVKDVIAVGANHVFFQLFDFRDLDALDLLAREVLPRLKA